MSGKFNSLAPSYTSNKMGNSSSSSSSYSSASIRAQDNYVERNYASFNAHVNSKGNKYGPNQVKGALRAMAYNNLKPNDYVGVSDCSGYRPR